MTTMNNETCELNRVQRLMEGKLSLSEELPDGVDMSALSLESQRDAEFKSANVEEKYQAAYDEAGGRKAVEKGLKDCGKELRLFRWQCQRKELQQTQLITWQGKSVPTYLKNNYDDSGREVATKLLEDMLSKINTVDPSATLEIAKRKGLIRTMMKCRMKYGNDVTKLTDAERCTVTVSNIRKVYAALKIILQEYGRRRCRGSVTKEILFSQFDKAPPKKEHMVVVEVNDRFEKPYEIKYCHLQVLLRIWGVIWEVQINVPSILKVKKESGHDFYKTTRFVQEYLLMCSFRNDMGMMNELLSCDGVERILDPNAVKDRNGLSCLHHAATAPSPKMTQMLVDRCANAWAIDDSEKWFPITFAMACRQWDSADILARTMLDDSDRMKTLLATQGEEDVEDAVQSCARWLDTVMEEIDECSDNHGALKELHERWGKILAGLLKMPPSVKMWLVVFWFTLNGPQLYHAVRYSWREASHYFQYEFCYSYLDFGFYFWRNFLWYSLPGILASLFMTFLHIFASRDIQRGPVVYLLAVATIAKLVLDILLIGIYSGLWILLCLGQVLTVVLGVLIKQNVKKYTAFAYMMCQCALAVYGVILCALDHYGIIEIEEPWWYY